MLGKMFGFWRLAVSEEIKDGALIKYLYVGYQMLYYQIHNAMLTKGGGSRQGLEPKSRYSAPVFWCLSLATLIASCLIKFTNR